MCGACWRQCWRLWRLEARPTPGQRVQAQRCISLCRAEACKSVGADRVATHAQKALGIEWHETTTDGKVTLEPVFCLGLCACAPAALVDGKLVGRVDEAKIDSIIGGLK